MQTAIRQVKQFQLSPKLSEPANDPPIVNLAPDPKQLRLRHRIGAVRRARQDKPGVVLLPQHMIRIRPQ
jgi:hypothetical protein